MTEKQKYMVGGYPHIQELINGIGYDFLNHKFVRGDNDCDLDNMMDLRSELMMVLKEQDAADALTRYTAFNFPDITTQELEKLLYLYGSILMFPLKTPNGPKFYYMKYALDGEGDASLDLYGRYKYVKPIAFNGQDSSVAIALNDTRVEVLYSLEELETKEFTSEDDLYKYGVIIYDREPLLARSPIPRVRLQEPIISVMADCIPYMNTALALSTGVAGMRVIDQNNQTEVDDANKQFRRAALTGKKWLPIVGTIEMQEFANKNTSGAEDYLMAMQSLDNLRLSTMGLSSGGVFEKSAHTLQSEQDMNSARAHSALSLGLMSRQWACMLANALWGYGVWYEISEVAAGVDKNGDMMADDSGNALNSLNTETDEGGSEYVEE